MRTNGKKKQNLVAKLRKTIQKIQDKNLEMLPAWQEENPNFCDMNTKENEEYIKISLHSLGDIENQENKMKKL